jgi:predicted nucleic acid-binding protein
VRDVLVDSSVWSLAFRRKSRAQRNVIVNELEDLVREMRVRMIGPIRQEILSGISEQKQFDLLKTRLRAFPDLHLEEEIFERAAEIFNVCRKAGIQGSNTDFLICAAAEQNDLAIFTTEQDFLRYNNYSKYILYKPRTTE